MEPVNGCFGEVSALLAIDCKHAGIYSINIGHYYVDFFFHAAETAAGGLAAVSACLVVVLVILHCKNV